MLWEEPRTSDCVKEEHESNSFGSDCCPASLGEHFLCALGAFAPLRVRYPYLSFEPSRLKSLPRTRIRGRSYNHYNGAMDVERFEKLLEQGQDSAMLRFTLGQGYLKNGDPAAAARHLARAVEHDRGYSAAWKLYGRALAESGETDRAMAVYREGIDIAESKGDKQAVKEMQVFLKRLEKNA